MNKSRIRVQSRRLSMMSHGLLILLLQSSGSAAQTVDSVSYRQDVAPLLQKYCLGCHNSTDAEHGLSLQSPADIKRGDDDGAVLHAEEPTQSRLLKVLFSTESDHMPPPDEPQLSADELRLLRAWITEGAIFEQSERGMALSVPSIKVTADRISDPIHSLAASADGKLTAAGRFRQVSLLDATSHDTISVIEVPDGKVTKVSFLPDSRQLLVATGITGFSGRAILIDVDSGKLIQQFDGHNDLVYAVCRSADGKIATAGYDRRIFLHDQASGKIIHTMAGHNGAVFDLAFSPDGTLLASASGDATVKVWSVATGERLDTMSQPLAEQYALVFSPGGEFLFAAGADSRIRKWRVISRTSPRINPLIEARFAHEGAIHQLSISMDGQFLASAAEDGTLKIWDASTLKELSSHRQDSDLFTAIAFSRTRDELLAGTASGKVLSFALPGRTAAAAKVAVARPPVTEAKSVEAPLKEISEAEPNDSPANAQQVPFPVTVAGVIDQASEADSGNVSAFKGDADYFRFHAAAGQKVFLETRASREKSPLDSRIEVLDEHGQPMLQTRLQAVRDSYFTFRGKDSDTADDFRMFNWQEMELNEYLYADGEVVRLWLYPRGPDSGFKVYPGFGKRYTYFGTTPTAHALQAPAFIVVPHAPDETITDNGLPVFPVYYENDDDPLREWGTDSRLLFHAPAEGNYLVRVTDARGFSGPDFKYSLTIRDPRPDFQVTLAGEKVRVQPGTGREISFTTQRIDGFTGPIDLQVEGLPAGFTTSLPTEIQQDQQQAFAIVYAGEDAVQPDAEALQKVRFFARAEIDGHEVVHEIGGLAELAVTEASKIRVSIHSPEQIAEGRAEHLSEMTAWAGETTSAFVRVHRQKFDGNVEFGKEDSGRNLPHGVFVDDIGLNGLMIMQGQQEREFFITVAKWVPETSRTFYLKTNVDGVTSLPVTLHIRQRSADKPTAETAAR